MNLMTPCKGLAEDFPLKFFPRIAMSLDVQKCGKAVEKPEGVNIVLALASILFGPEKVACLTEAY